MPYVSVKDMFKVFCTHCGSDNLIYSPNSIIECNVDGKGKHKERDSYKLSLAEVVCNDCKKPSYVDIDNYNFQ